MELRTGSRSSRSRTGSERQWLSLGDGLPTCAAAKNLATPASTYWRSWHRSVTDHLCGRVRSWRRWFGEPLQAEGLLVQRGVFHEQGREPEQGPRAVSGVPVRRDGQGSEAVHSRKRQRSVATHPVGDGCGGHGGLPRSDAAGLWRIGHRGVPEALGSHVFHGTALPECKGPESRWL